MDEILYAKKRPRDEGTDGLALFAGPVPAQEHSPTSVAAGEAMQPKAPGKRERVLAFICEFTETHKRGPTDEEIVEHFRAQGWSLNTPRARRVELYIGVTDKATGERVGGGWIREGGTREGRTEWVPTAERGWRWWLTKVHPEAA